MASASEDKWKEAFEAVKEQFELTELLQEQEGAIKAFLLGKNVFVNLPTGFGKSLIFQCLPIVADIVHGQPRGSSVIVVISPLRSLMEDQVQYLNGICIPAIAITDLEHPETIQQVLNGNFIVVFGSPECLLSTAVWRGIFKSESFTEKLIGVAIDEAHCITQWGLPGAKNKVPFRKWYGCLGEIRSLIPSGCQILVLTATASKTTKQQIFHTLHLSDKDIKMIEESPDRANLFYATLYLDKNDSIELSFVSLINEVKNVKVETERTLIYCQTRKQCSVLFRMFEVYLGKHLYHGDTSPRNRMVEMYHAGTPASVKDHISRSMALDDGHLRVLICTVAFGMGVNCKKVGRVVHFGPSKSVEMYIQECGRAGRDGLASTCVLLYNGLLSTHCDTDMKQYLQVEQCRRRWLMAQFGSQTSTANLAQKSHECCDICAGKCKCGNENCGKFWSPCKDRANLPSLSMGPSKDDYEMEIVRTVTEQDKSTLRKKLLEFQQQMLKQVQVDKMVSCPNILLEFNGFHIDQVVESCEKLFSVEDIKGSVEIWRHQYAIGVLKVLSDVFGDIEIAQLGDEDTDLMEDSIVSDWGHIRDDSAFASILNVDSQDFEDISTFMDTDTSHDTISGASNMGE